MSNELVKIDYEVLMQRARSEAATGNDVQKLNLEYFIEIIQWAKSYEEKGALGKVVELVNPFGGLRAITIRHCLKSLSRRFSRRAQLTVDDATNIETLIAAGRTQNVSEMEITVSKEELAGLKAGLKTPPGTQVVMPDVQFGISSTSTYIIKVKYNDAKGT